MSYCTPCPPCDTEFPLLCEPLETTANGKRLVVEDSAACQKTIQSPVAQQVLKTDGSGNLTWTNGASGTVLRKDSTGLLEFATLNSVLQSAPVNLGSQPLTTTGTLSSGAITTTSVTATGASNGASVTATGAVSGASVTATGAINGASVTATGAVSGASAIITGSVGIGTSTPDAPLEVNVSSGGVDGNYRSSILGISNTNQGQLEIRHGASTPTPTSRWSSLQAWSNGLTNPVPLLLNKDGGSVGIGTTTPVNKLQVVGSFGRGAPVTKTVDFTLADTENWIIVNKGSSCTVTLPAASLWLGREFTIKVITAHTVVSASSNIVPANSATPGTAILSATAGAWATLVSDGTNWVIMANA